MSEPLAARIADFRGLGDQYYKAGLPEQLADTDEGSDHSKRGAWLLRRGMTHSPLAQLASGVTAMGGFETINGSFSLWVVDESGNFTGYPTQAFGGEGGYGEGGEGDGGYGT